MAKSHLIGISIKSNILMNVREEENTRETYPSDEGKEVEEKTLSHKI